MFLKRTTLCFIFAAVAVSGCATTGGGKFKNIFDDDIAQNRSSVLHGSAPKAVTDLTMLIEMDPKNSEARYLRALAYQKLEHYNKAVEDYETLLKYDENNSKAHYNLAMILAFKTGDKKGALKHFDEFISLNPDHARAFSAAKVMLSLESESGPADTDEPELKQIIEEVLAEKGLMRLNSEENIHKRKKKIAEIIRLNPQSADARFVMAKVMEEEGRTDEAIRTYEAALELKPTFAECHYELGQLLTKTKRKNEGQIHLFKAELFRPNGS